MIVDQRIYTLHPGCVPRWIETMETRGFRIQEPVLGKSVGYYFTEFGPLNQIVHMWAYDSMEQRAERRAQLRRTPGWDEIRNELMPYVHHQENRLLIPAPFFRVG